MSCRGLRDCGFGCKLYSKEGTALSVPGRFRPTPRFLGIDLQYIGRELEIVFGRRLQRSRALALVL
jgi:hypothetical protein